ILPPTMPGHQPYCPYTLHPSPSGAWTAPNLARARRLVRASGTHGDKVTVPDLTPRGPVPVAMARYVASVLDQLGYRAWVALFATYNPYTSFTQAPRHRPQLSFFTWYQDFPAPSDFIDPLFTCGSFLPHDQSNANVAEFCDPRIDTQVRKALALQARGLAAAAPGWAAIDHELVDKAIWVPMFNPRVLTVLSARVGNYHLHPSGTLPIDQRWVRYRRLHQRP